MGEDAKTYVTISEAADRVGIPSYVLRFWESKFPMLQPLRLSGGRRYYRQADLDLLSEIKRLVHEKGYSLRGARVVVEELLKAASLNAAKPSKAANQSALPPLSSPQSSSQAANAGVAILASAATLPVTLHLGNDTPKDWLALSPIASDTALDTEGGLGQGFDRAVDQDLLISPTNPIQHESVTQLVKFLVQELRDLKKLLQSA
ncbi:MAG: MerR family transcriptional regulator [Alphaproteobacteria bacterium]|nr:MerR family transcriptional regulator [Alphaproteobacteria bacterium]